MVHIRKVQICQCAVHCMGSHRGQCPTEVRGQHPDGLTGGSFFSVLFESLTSVTFCVKLKNLKIT